MSAVPYPPASEPVREPAPLDVLVLAPQPLFQARGTPIAVRALLDVLGALGHRVDVLTFPGGEPTELPGCTLHYVLPGRSAERMRPGFSGAKLARDAVMLAQSARMARRKRYHLVHAVEEAAFIALLLKRAFGVPFVYDMDSSLPQQLADRHAWLQRVAGSMERLEALAIRESLGVVAVCRALEERAVRGGGRVVARIEDFSLLEPLAPAEPAALQRERPTIMYVGNLEPYQGIELLLRGFAVAQARVPAARLVIVGGDAGGIQRYRALAAELGIAEHAEFAGPRPVTDLRRVLAEADVLVSPRIQGQNTPMKVYSYLDSGRPLLATRLPTHTQVLDDEIALLAEPTPAALGAGLVVLLRDPARRAALARRARARVDAEFSPAAYRRKMAAFYARLGAELARR